MKSVEHFENSKSLYVFYICLLFVLTCWQEKTFFIFLQPFTNYKNIVKSIRTYDSIPVAELIIVNNLCGRVFTIFLIIF